MTTVLKCPSLLPRQGPTDGNRPLCSPGPTTSITPRAGQLDFACLNDLIRHFVYQGLADSTHRTYTTGPNRFLSFCYTFFVVDPFHVSERVALFLCGCSGSPRPSPGHYLYLSGSGPPRPGSAGASRTAGAVNATTPPIDAEWCALRPRPEGAIPW